MSGNLSESEKLVKYFPVSAEGEADPGLASAKQPAARSLLHSARQEAERNVISQALQETRWNRRAAARMLNVSYRTLLNKIQQLDMSPEKH